MGDSRRHWRILRPDAGWRLCFGRSRDCCAAVPVQWRFDRESREYQKSVADRTLQRHGRDPDRVPPKDVAIDLPFPSQWAYDPYTKNPNTWNWSLTVERNMGGNVLLRGAYVASRGTHLIGGYEQNLPVYIPGASSLANRQERRPDPKFQSINVSSGIADSYYHSLQVTGEKRYSNGLTFVANYTLSKSIDTGSNDIGWSGAFGNQDPRGPWFNRGLSEFDRTHVVNSSVVWDLPRSLRGMPLFGPWRVIGRSRES